jgi:hypothetical protein
MVKVRVRLSSAVPDEPPHAASVRAMVAAAAVAVVRSLFSRLMVSVVPVLDIPENRGGSVGIRDCDDHYIDIVVTIITI